jgi:serine protease
MRSWRRAAGLAALCALALGGTPAFAAPWRAPQPDQVPTDRVIVKWRESGFAATQVQGMAARTARLSEFTGVPLSPIREIRDRVAVVRIAQPLAGGSMRRLVARLKADPAVQYAEPDERRYVLAFPADPPNDPRFVAGSDANGTWSGQWYLHDSSSTTPAAVGATTAWKQGYSGKNFVIAIIDTGIDLTHPDLGLFGQGGKLLPGRDFICNDQGTDCNVTSADKTYLVANDFSGWDLDPTDPGDWISAADLARADGFFKGCGDGPNHDQPYDSTWHGTRVAGIAGAITNNGVGVAGVAYGSYLLPVRVIGKCSGYMSDIVAGMYWAAGLTNTSISFLASNTYPAQVLNMSLGGRAPCSQTEQDAVTAITQAGHVIVAAAGNDGGPVDAPANCVGALSVAGIRQVGTKVGYSNVSSTAAAITIAAPAGNCVNLNTDHPYQLPCLYSIETTSNDGKTVPENPFYTYAQFVPGYSGNLLNEGSAGTSYAAPIVSGVVAMMVQANPYLNAAQIIERMQAGALPFPVPATPPAGGVCHVASLAQDSSGNYTDVQSNECQCTTATCGAGMLNAPGALAQAQAPQADISASPNPAAVGQTITLDGSGSSAASGYSITAYQWSVDPSVAIENPNSAVASLKFPAFRPITVTLVVTDSANRRSTATQVVNSRVYPKDGTGGGGALGWADLAVLLIGALGSLSPALSGVFLRRRAPSAAMLRGWLGPTGSLRPRRTIQES